MMKYKLSLSQLLFSSLFVFSLLLISSCSKEKSSGDTEAQEREVSMVSSQADAEAEIVFNGIFDDVMGVNNDVGMAGTGIFGRTAIANDPGSEETARPTACFTVTITHPTSNIFPARVLIDFGNAPCVGRDGHSRQGQIIIEYSNRLIMPGATASTTFHNFFFDDTKVEGTHKISNTSSPIGTLPVSRQFRLEVIDGKLTRPNGNYIEWNSSKTITQVEGLATPDSPMDDIFKIEGSARGRALRNNLLVAWESKVIEPLIKKFSCRWIVKGVVETVRATSSTTNPWIASLNFGNGNCDNQAMVTINGVPHQITLW